MLGEKGSFELGIHCGNESDCQLPAKANTQLTNLNRESKPSLPRSRNVIFTMFVLPALENFPNLM